MIKMMGGAWLCASVVDWMFGCGRGSLKMYADERELVLSLRHD